VALECTEGVRLATKRHCKFVEVSALLDHKVDELLVGVVRQIRLRQTRNDDDETGRTPDHDELAHGGGGGAGGRLASTLGAALRRLVDRATPPTLRRRRRRDATARPSIAECNNLFTP